MTQTKSMPPDSSIGRAFHAAVPALEDDLPFRPVRGHTPAVPVGWSDRFDGPGAGGGAELPRAISVEVQARGARRRGVATAAAARIVVDVLGVDAPAIDEGGVGVGPRPRSVVDLWCRRRCGGSGAGSGVSGPAASVGRGRSSPWAAVPPEPAAGELVGVSAGGAEAAGSARRRTLSTQAAARRRRAATRTIEGPGLHGFFTVSSGLTE